MSESRTLMQERSKLLFGQVHRLALMIAIAESDGRVNPTELTYQLGLAQSAFQAPLRDLEAAGLLERQLDGMRRTYVRRQSKVWEWVLDLADEIREQERQRQVSLLRASGDGA